VNAQKSLDNIVDAMEGKLPPPQIVAFQAEMSIVIMKLKTSDKELNAALLDVECLQGQLETVLLCHKQLSDSIAQTPPVYMSGDTHLQKDLDLTPGLKPNEKLSADPCMCGDRLGDCDTMTCRNCGGTI